MNITRYRAGIYAGALLPVILSGCGGGSGGDSGGGVQGAPAATLSLAIAPTSIAIGTSAALTWSATNAASCTASGSWTGAQATAGTVTVSPTTAGAYTYTLTCPNSAGSPAAASAMLTVTVPPAPTVTMSFAPNPVVQATAATLTWSSTNATTCTASGFWFGTKATSGTLVVNTPTVGTFPYTLTCQNAVAVSATGNATLSVNIPPKFTLGANTIRAVSGSAPVNAPFLGLHQFFDLDGDGWGDLIWTGAYFTSNPAPAIAQQGYVAFNGPAGFVAAAPAKFPYATLLDVHAREFAFVDFNGDGIRDVFVADHGYDAPPFPGFQNRLLLSQSGTPNWVDATANLPQQSDYTHSVCTGDVNGGGQVDIFAGNGGLPDAYFLIGNGTGAFAKNSQILPINPGQALQNANVGFTSCELVDLDGDALPELVLGTGYQSRSTQVLWNSGGSYAADTVASGTITALPEPANFGTSWSIYEIQPTDLNGDGRQDLIVVYFAELLNGGWQFQFLVNQGNKQFLDQTATYLPDAAAVSSGVPTAQDRKSWIAFLIPRDLNGDGRLDYWVEAKRMTGILNDNLPIALIRQANGSFVPIKVGELRAAGVPDFYFNLVGYASRGASLPGELVQAFADSSAGNQIKINSQAITFH